MARRLSCLVALAFLFGALLQTASAAPLAQGGSCQFVLGFKALHDAIPGVVGDCKTDERYDPASGNSVQETTNG